MGGSYLLMRRPVRRLMKSAEQGYQWSTDKTRVVDRSRQTKESPRKESRQDLVVDRGGGQRGSTEEDPISWFGHPAGC